MKVCIIGSGYVGLVTGACLANLGNQVFCIDKDYKKLESLKNGIVPFFEPGLEELVKFNSKNKRLFFSTNLDDAVKQSDVIFIAVATPPKNDGSADISNVIKVAKNIANSLKSIKTKNFYKVIVNKSTVPVGMGDIVHKILRKHNIPQKNFSVVSNPEFLSEGNAINDFMNPDRIVIGAIDTKAFDTITELYRSLNAHIIFTDIKTAEMIKYVSNSFLATKISFINEIANICERVGVDVVKLANAVGLDKRIGRYFLNAGIGYGGSCLPKDVSAIVSLSKKMGYKPCLLETLNKINEQQVDLILNKILKVLKSPKNKKVAVFGLSFKPGTDDIRESPSIKLISKLTKKGFSVHAYDPVVKEIPSIKNLVIEKDIYSAAKGSDAAIFVTDWPIFKQIEVELLKKSLKKLYVFDARNMLNPKLMKEQGFKYFGVGR